MSLLVVSSIEKMFGPDVILDGVGFRLEWGQKLGLVGRNGAGKTTLLRILTGQLEPDKGAVNYTPGIRFGYLRQEQMVEHGWTVYEEARDAFGPVLQMEQRMRELEGRMGDSSDPEALQATMDEYGLLRDRFEAMGGFENLRDIHGVLKRLGFSEGDQEKPTAKLSGGEKTRLAVAKLLLSAPDILLLDEPTNHLDLQATEWLEGFLRDFGGAVILVSHDRYFLDRVVTSLAEVENGRLTLYKGNYSAYAVQKQANRARQAELFEREQREVQRLTEFFEKWKNTPSKRSQAVMRMRWAERIKANMTERPTHDAKSMKVAVKEKIRSGNEVMIVDHLTKRFGERTLFEDVSLLIQRGQRVGVVGPNGAGKSTMIRMLLGREQPTSGSIRLGANVTVGYFAQEASDLDLEATVLENMMDVAEMLPTEARTHLGKFLFTGDDAFRPVAKLSGGEKNKLVLAQLTYLRPNLLILDEPTNHLDIDSREALVQMLRAYDGTLILVSHDRYLLDEATTQTMEVADGRAKLYDGPYRAYKELKEKERATQAVVSAKSPSQLSTLNSQLSPTAGMNSHQLSKERQKAVKAVTAAEKKVADVEDWMKRIEEALSAPTAADDVIQLSHDHERAQKDLEAAMEAWEKAVAYAEGIGAAV
jgi:ATP-binding cassette subfamily F protein 3